MNSEAWDAFWTEDQQSARGGCLSGRSSTLEREQKLFWQQFAKALPKGARVLDLATGDGVLLRWLIAARPDLKLTGIDLSTQIPPAPRGCEVRGGIAMEALPFADESFDALVSQFGLEYADVARATAEAGRVLKAKGRLALVTHRLDSPIVQHNLTRREGLRWALDEARLPDKARGSLKLQAMGLGLAPAIRLAPATAMQRFGAGSAAWEFAEAMLQTLRSGAQQPTAVLSQIAGLENKAVNEIRRIDSLEVAARAAADAEALKHVFASNGFQMQNEHHLQERTGARPFANAWLLVKDGGEAPQR